MNGIEEIDAAVFEVTAQKSLARPISKTFSRHHDVTPNDEPHQGDAALHRERDQKLLVERGVELLIGGPRRSAGVYKEIHAVMAFTHRFAVLIAAILFALFATHSFAAETPARTSAERSEPTAPAPSATRSSATSSTTVPRPSQ